MLLTRGANPSAANKKGMTAAMFASLFARIAVLELLHQRESESPTGGAPADAGSTAGAALLNTADARGNTALHHAALCGHGKVARTLVRALGAHATARNLGGKTPADVAVDKATFNAIIGRE
jgi:ankyrin repeat protein